MHRSMCVSLFAALSVFKCWHANLKCCANALSNIWLDTHQLHAVVLPSSSHSGRQTRQIFASSPNRPSPLAQSASLPQKCAISPAASPNAAVQCMLMASALASRAQRGCRQPPPPPPSPAAAWRSACARCRSWPTRRDAPEQREQGSVGSEGQCVGGSEDWSRVQVRSVGWLQATTPR